MRGAAHTRAVDPSQLVTAWSPNALGIALPVVAAAFYLVAVSRVRRRGHAWAGWRVVVWLSTCALALWTLAGAPWTLRLTDGWGEWMDGVAVGFAAAVLPLGAALGDPVRLAGLVRGADGPPGVATGRIARALMLPGVSSALSAIFLTAALMSHWYAPHATPAWSWGLLLAGAFATGLAVNLPLLTDDLLPSWASPGVKTLIAFVDGVFDAVPGIVVMLGASMAAGGALLCVAEAIGIPMIAATLVQWMRADEAAARRMDAELDARPTSSGPWWEEDPRFADRFGPRGRA